jgi:DNA-binding transcriptional MerR regulator
MTTKEVAKRTGATLRQLQWWDERGYVSPKIVGHSREYTDAQVAIIKRAAILRQAGIGNNALHVAKRIKTDPIELRDLIRQVQKLGLRLR